MSAQNNSPSNWVGWTYFGGFMMMLLGGAQVIAGLTGIFKDSYYAVSQSQLLVFNYKAWGWIYLILGIIIFMAGLEIYRGAAWARSLGVFLAGLSFFANIAFLNAYPTWAVVMMIVDVLIIYSLVVRGGELA